MIGKTVYFLAFLVTIAVVADAKFTRPSEVVAGQRQLGDRLVLHQSIVKGSKWLLKVVEDKTFDVDVDYSITMVRLRDKSTNGKGATARIVGGGPGFSNVNVIFKSRRGHGIKYEVEIYARPT